VKTCELILSEEEFKKLSDYAIKTNSLWRVMYYFRAIQDNVRRWTWKIHYWRIYYTRKF
jgi:hypothetical protein